MPRSGDCGERPRWPCEPLAGGSGSGDGPSSGHRIQACRDRRQHASAGLHMPATRKIPVGWQYPHAPPPPPRTSTQYSTPGAGRWTVDCETASRGDQPCGGRRPLRGGSAGAEPGRRPAPVRPPRALVPRPSRLTTAAAWSVTTSTTTRRCGPAASSSRAVTLHPVGVSPHHPDRLIPAPSSLQDGRNTQVERRSSRAAATSPCQSLCGRTPIAVSSAQCCSPDSTLAISTQCRHRSGPEHYDRRLGTCHNT
jgi:hypothetical protein